jgi:lipid-binding SYLF domain-containing protein
MKKLIRTIMIPLVVALTSTILAGQRPAMAADAKTIDRDARAALSALYDTTPAARILGEKAKAILVFPKILKAGFVVGAQHGKGALLVNGKTEAYYNISAASYGFQAGVQKFGYALFLMSDSARAYIDKSGGWELGAGPSVVVVDAGVAKTLSTTTAKDDVYAFTFGQKGLMAGLGLQGTKITRVNR